MLLDNCKKSFKVSQNHASLAWKSWLHIKLNFLLYSSAAAKTEAEPQTHVYVTGAEQSSTRGNYCTGLHPSTFKVAEKAWQEHWK
jgi:hypothetical protein